MHGSYIMKENETIVNGDNMVSVAGKFMEIVMGKRIG
jgi:hypothetical protein